METVEQRHRDAGLVDDLVCRIKRIRTGDLTGIACAHSWDTSVCPMKGCGDDEDDLINQLLATLAIPPSGIAEAVKERCAEVAESQFIDTRGIHATGTQIASAIRALDLSDMGGKG